MTITAGGKHRKAVPLALSGLAATAAVGLLAACGSQSAASGAAAGPGTSSGSAVLATRQVSGVGTVLVDKSGKTVYSPDQESGGMVRCTGGCLSFWFPVTVSPAAASTLPSGLGGTVSTIKRPDDGQMQVTFNGKPLYTFRLDQAPGQAQGNNFDDSFGGTAFTWRAVSTSGSGNGGAVPSQSPTGSGGNGSGGYGSGGY